ncbi:MAG: penicillin acylase family protein, partial [Rectinemataceae bacterium]
KVTLGVKVFGPLVWPVEKTILRTVYGPALRTETGTYAIRFSNFDRIDVIEELYGMNRAQDFGQWRKAVESQALPCFNIGYADSEGRIFYLYNAHIPIRDEAYNWKGKLDGTTSRTLWTEYLPFERMPMVLDPPSGFIQSCNSSPFETTTGPGNPAESDYSKTLGIETWMTNRALRARELFGADDAGISYEKFFAFKFDMKYSEKSDVARLVSLLAADESLSSELERKGRELLASWNLGSDSGNRATALPILTLGQLYMKHEGFSISRLTSIPLPYPEVVAAFREALGLLVANFGRIDPEWGQVNRLVRGGTNLPLDGAPDVIRAVYGMPQKNGTMIGENGDCYIMMVRWDGKGGLDSQSIHQFGSATSRPESPHYADQAILFAERRFKKVLMDESEIRADAERVYSP